MEKWFERLTSLDFSFLNLESRSAHMHVGGLAIFEGAAPSYRELADHIQSRLERVPRYRQRLALVPFGQGRPVWIDDAQFALDYHLRHSALPSPGDEDQLHRLAGRLFSQQLDRNKPLWELWFIEGIAPAVGADPKTARPRFALLSKTHHCMVDGISGVDIATVLLDADPKTPRRRPGVWAPRPAPSSAELLVSSLRHQIAHPVKIARDAMEPGSDARALLLEVAAGLRPLLKLARMGQAPSTSLNVPIGPHRRFVTARLDLADVRRVRASLGGTVNDVLLTVVAGAVRERLLARGETLGPDLRVMVPVSVRSSDQRGRLGNQVTLIFGQLPVAESNPVERLRRVRESMKGLKESRQALGAVALSKLSDFAPPTLLTQAARAQSRARFFNLVVTNVPGPQMPLFLLGRPMLDCYPLVPLAALQTIGIALLSYNGGIGVGLLGDADGARDLDELGKAISASLAELVSHAGSAQASVG